MARLADTFYARCPYCQTLFRVRSEHLTIADGRVRCGNCFGVFLATEHVAMVAPERVEPAEPPPVPTAASEPAPTAPPANPLASSKVSAKATASTLDAPVFNELGEDFDGDEPIAPSPADTAIPSSLASMLTAPARAVVVSRQGEWDDSPVHALPARDISEPELEEEPVALWQRDEPPPADDDEDNWLLDDDDRRFDDDNGLVDDGDSDERYHDDFGIDDIDNDDEEASRLRPSPVPELPDFDPDDDDFEIEDEWLDDSVLGPLPGHHASHRREPTWAPDDGETLSLTALRTDETSVEPDDEILTTADTDDDEPLTWPEPSVSSEDAVEEVDAPWLDDASLIGDEAEDDETDTDPIEREHELVADDGTDALRASSDAEPERWLAGSENLVEEELLASLSTPSESPLRLFFWGLGSLILLAALATQVLWSYRDRLAQKPAWRPAMEQFCDLLHCDLSPLRDIARIELVSRALQPNLTMPGAFDVHLMLRNRADFPQPYPEIELAFTDLDGKHLAVRRFAPAEYLSGDARNQLMPAGVPVHVRFSIVAPDPSATGFEFRFH